MAEPPIDLDALELDDLEHGGFGRWMTRVRFSARLPSREVLQATVWNDGLSPDAWNWEVALMEGENEVELLAQGTADAADRARDLCEAAIERARKAATEVS